MTSRGRMLILVGGSLKKEGPIQRQKTVGIRNIAFVVQMWVLILGFQGMFPLGILNNAPRRQNIAAPKCVEFSVMK